MNKRLINLLKNESQRYTLLGVLFGLIFPVLATVIRLAATKNSFGLINLINLHSSDPLMWIIDTAPIFLGFFASVAGRRQDNLQKLYNEIRLREMELGDTQIALEKRVSIRTSDLERSTLELETISDVAREISTIRDVSTLLNVSVNLIRERFNYYHTAIFLMDELGESAILQAASGAAAQQMIEQRYRLNIDPRSDLGTALREGQAYISLDVAKDMVLTRNPLLPETISEIVLPLRVLSRTIGVLDIQSNRSTYFDERNVNTLGLLVDQLAAAIENARLLQKVEGTVNELNKAYRLETQKAWQTTVDERAVTAYEYDGQQIRPIPNNLPIELLMQLESGKAVVIKEKIGIQDGINNVLLVPMKVLNQLIGVIGLEQKNPNHAWTNDEIAVAEAAANRAALTLENARLIEESQRRALKERTISDATSRIGTALNIENILDITARELERIIGDSEVILQIDTESRPTTER